MTYNPNREQLTELISAWNSGAQTISPHTSGVNTYLGQTIGLDTLGEGDGDLSITSSVINLPEDGLYGYFVGDYRLTTVGAAAGDIFSINFNNSDGAFSAGFQYQRSNFNDDQCYALYDSAKMVIGWAMIATGQTIYPYVRVLGVLVEQ